MQRLALWMLSTLLLAAVSLNAQPIPQYRVLWVDTFNTPLFNHNDVVAVVSNAKAANANAILAQVRRRGDAFYLSATEPPPDFTTIPAGFDILADLIAAAHAQGIEVHAFCITADIWSKNPTFAPTATLGPPVSPNHVFNRHGGYDSVSKTIVPGANNWLTRQYPTYGLLGSTFDGHRFGSDFWLDFGHPDAAQYTYDVLMELVRNYDIDGLHLDRIRYPDISVSGQTPATGTNIGYNTTNVARFQQHYGITPGSAPPLPNDARWSQWRRDQVSALVRRVYLNAIAIKPQIKISAALIAFGGGPVTEASWNNAEAYWRVFQDWRAWTEEGILDVAMPMTYKREHTPAEVTQFEQWSEWTKNHQYNRAGILAVGGLVNAVEGSLRQARRALQPSSKGNAAPGVVFYSMATSNVAVSPNPFSIPPNQSTPLRPYSEFASGLTTGKSVNGATLYEPVNANGPLFANAATVPVFVWKSQPSRGHLMGIAKHTDNSVIDTASVTVLDAVTNTPVKTTTTDGNGFFGAVDLQPGQYIAKIDENGAVYYSCIADVAAGMVARADAGFDSPPQITAPANIVTTTDAGSCWATVDPGAPTIVDNCSGYRVTGTRNDNLTLNSVYPRGVTTITWRVTDSIGQTSTATQTVTVSDSQPPSITNVSVSNAQLWPANHKMVNVKVSYEAADSCGSATTSISVTSNEPENGLGDGDTGPDIVIVNDHLVSLRAERSGLGTGRVYTIRVNATDASGNTSTATATVTVPLNQGQ